MYAANMEQTTMTSLGLNSTDNDTDTDNDELLDAFRNIRSMKFYSLIVVISVGIISNLLALFVLSNSYIKKTSTGVYLIFLSLADTIVLTGEFVNWLHEETVRGSVLGIYLMHSSNAACRNFHYIRYFGRIWSCWLIVIITVERYLSIAHPLRVNSISKPKKALIICVVEMAIVALLCLPAFFTLGIKKTGEPAWIKCAIIKKNEYHWFVLYPLIFAGEMVLPSVIVFTFTMLILYHLYKANQLRKMISISQPNSNSSQLTSMLLGLALTFIFIRLPYIITYLLRKKLPYRRDWNNLYLHAAEDASYVLSVANYAINFFLYCLCGSIFRSELCRVLCSRWITRRPATTYVLDQHSSPGSRVQRLSRVQYNGIGTQMAAV